MERIPPTQKSDLEKSVEALRTEEQHWRRLGLDPNNTVHPPGSLWHMKLQVRALFEALTETGVIDRETLELTFNRIVLEAMQKIRLEQEVQQSIAVPKPTILDPQGREIKL